jgi:hypothetical protein
LSRPILKNRKRQRASGGFVFVFIVCSFFAATLPHMRRTEFFGSLLSFGGDYFYSAVIARLGRGRDVGRRGDAQIREGKAQPPQSLAMYY